jgi:hypothetical protein
VLYGRITWEKAWAPFLDYTLCGKAASAVIEKAQVDLSKRRRKNRLINLQQFHVNRCFKPEIFDLDEWQFLFQRAIQF